MNQEIKNEWVTALRSGDYKQGQSLLRRTEDDDVYPDGYCCLGVLCELAVQHAVIPPAQLDESDSYYVYGEAKDRKGAYLPRKVRDWADTDSTSPVVTLPSGGRANLPSLNDSGFTFDQIADVIEQFA
jgi:hypothetical protein